MHENKQQKTKKLVTEKQKAKKTKNNVQKTVLKPAAVIISFVLISFTVSGRELREKLPGENYLNNISTTTGPAEKKNHVKTTVAFNTELLNEEAEPELKIEPWMTDEAVFNIAFNMATEETEPAMSVEKWMLNDNLFSVNKITDEEMEIENWMISEKLWNL